jgi:hypothetical protein
MCQICGIEFIEIKWCHGYWSLQNRTAQNSLAAWDQRKFQHLWKQVLCYPQPVQLQSHSLHLYDQQVPQTKESQAVGSLQEAIMVTTWCPETLWCNWWPLPLLSTVHQITHQITVSQMETVGQMCSSHLCLLAVLQQFNKEQWTQVKCTHHHLSPWWLQVLCQLDPLVRWNHKIVTFVIGYDATDSSYSRSEGFTQNSFFLLLTCPPKVITKTLHPTLPASVRWVGALKSPLRCLYVWQEGNLFWSVSIQGSRVWKVFCKGEVHSFTLGFRMQASYFALSAFTVFVGLVHEIGSTLLTSFFLSCDEHPT